MQRTNPNRFQTLLGGLLGLVLALFSTIALAQARLESPAPEAFLRSGIGLIRGWACDAGRVEVSLDGGPLLATAQGTDRPDTAATCGRANTGFGLIYNWNRVGDGVHNLRAFADGVAFADVNFTVATLGGEFLTGLAGQYTVPDFPAPGEAARIGWSEPDQNFVLVKPTTVPPVADPPNPSRAALESPLQGASESGIGLIRGWVCDARRVEVSLDGGPLLATAQGTDRPDTAATCGRADTGFGLTYNWNRLGDGVHNLRAFADGVAFANVNFAVATLAADSEFVTGLLKKIRLLGFPGAGTAATAQAASETDPTTTLQWSEPDQNFVVAVSTAAGKKIALASLITDLRNKFALLGVGAQPESASNTLGVQATKNAQGQPTSVDGLTWADTDTRAWADLNLGPDGLPATYRDSGGMEARLDQFTDDSVTIRFFDGNTGQARGGPITAPIDGGLLQELRALIDQLRAASRASASAPAQAQPNTSYENPDAAVSAVPETLRFSLSALLVKLFGSGGIAAGETLCALRTAAVSAGVGNLVAATSCRSPLVADLLALAGGSAPQATTRNAALDLELQRSFQFVEDIADAPCGPSGDSADCLAPAATAIGGAIGGISAVPPDNPPTPVQVTVPNLAGLSQGAASTALQNAGLTVGTVTLQTSTTVPAGDVIRQDPAAGAPVAPGTSVNLVVSSGPPTAPPVIVPDVVGQSQGAASTALQNAGLTVGTVTLQTSATVPAGDVIRQDPAAGASVAPGTPVNLVVSSRPVTYLVTTNAGPGGSISPPSQTVGAGTRARFAVAPDSGYRIGSITGCGGDLAENTYITGPITADCTIIATFSPQILTVTAARVGCSGFIGPASQTVNYGDTASLNVIPGIACYVISVTGCSGSLNGNTYTTGPITANCTVTASFGSSLSPPGGIGIVP